MHTAPDRKTEFQTLIQDDPLLHSLAEMIIAGCPDHINDVSHALHPYHGHRNTLPVEDGLILQGEALIICLLEREKILQAIHEGHMGISKCQNRARHCVYWSGINSDIKCLTESCHGSEYLVVTDYYSQDAHCQKNPCISMQSLQGHLSPEKTLCRTWHPRGTLY